MTSIFHAGSWQQPARGPRALLFVAFLALCVGLATRYQLMNGFTILPGDRYDGVISATILEHWYHFFTGKADWSQVNYFFPYTRTIAQTDAYFLIGVVYFPFRLAGMDPFLAQEYANLTLRAVGFAGAYLFCRKVFSFNFYWALLAAGLLTVSNGLTAHSSRIQFVTVAFTPVLATMLWAALKALLEDDVKKFRTMGVLSAVLFGAWCMTCFYISWFFTFFFTILAAVMLVLCGPALRARLGRQLRAYWGSVLLVLGAALAAIFPFLYAFLPKSREVGVRSYDSVFGNTIPLQNILQVGEDNLLFGRLYNALLSVISPGYTPVGEYANTGFAPILFVLFACGCALVLRGWRGQRAQAQAQVLLPALVIATLLTWMLALRVGGYSGWFLVYHLFPGAKALNVVAAFQIFLAFPVVLLAIKYLSTQRLGMPIALLLAALLVTEELNRPYINLDRPAELARVALPQAPPAHCKTFYVSGWAGQDTLGKFPESINNAYAHNVSAMLIAQAVQLPTINGIASFSPKDWNFSKPNQADYDDRVYAYARRHHIDNLCRLDLNSKSWRAVSEQAIANGPDIYHHYYKRGDWPGQIVSERGLSFIEPWGVWSDAETVTFTFSQPLPAQFELRLRAHAFGTNAGKPFTVQVGQQKQQFMLGGATEEKRLLLSTAQAANSLTFTVPSPVSPSALGQGSDPRQLGIGFAEIRIVPR